MSKELSPDTTLSHYRIVSKIGAGGMGEVYLAQDTKLDRKVALKILPAEVAADRSRMSRFVQEAKTASALNHPNILTIYEIDQADSIYFIATEFIDGVTLRERIRKASMKLGEVLDVAIQTASALSAAHAAGIVHRDIKPENIMLRRDGIVKVLDFGLAKLTERLAPDSVDTEAPTSFKTDPGTVVGTAVYMSPEQARGMPVDARTDIFSLGIVLYEMVAGCLPFAGSTSSEVLAAILSDKEPQPLARYSREVPAELERLVAKALRKNRDQRYQTVQDLLLDLQSLKQELEFERKLERSLPPTTKSVADASEQAEGQTVMESATRPTVSERGRTSATKLNRRSAVIAVVALFVIASAAGAYFYFLRAHGGAIDSVAVMPFVNESGNAEVEYLSDGMTETLISSLSQLPNLSVKARSTVFRYKGKETNPKAIGKELNVQAILNGRVVQRGERLTLSLELIDAQTENVIWSDKYDRKQTDLVSLQNEIARDVSSKLKLKLSGADQQKLTKTYTTDPEAYRLYLQGRFYLNKRVGKLFDRAEAYFQQAIEKDPNFALGYVGLAEFISQRDRPKAKEYIMRALAIDNQLSDAHASLGYQLMLDYDFVASEREFRRAIELDPNNARAYQWNGSRLMMIGLYDEALGSLDRATEIEPTLADIRNNRGGCLVASGRIDDGIAEIKKSMELDPTFPWTHSHISFVYRMKGDRTASVEERARAFEPLDRADQAGRMRESFATSGWTGYLREIVSQDWGRLGTSGTRRASLLSELGEKEKAIASLNDAAAKGDYWLFSIKYDPAFDPLRGDPRFQELLKKFDTPK
jgi:serine/threonine protein kinase/Tfp pilus assembly protein PilF